MKTFFPTDSALTYLNTPVNHRAVICSQHVNSIACSASPTCPNLNVRMDSDSTQQYQSKYLSLLIHNPIFGPQNSLFLEKLEIVEFYIVNLLQRNWDAKRSPKTTTSHIHITYWPYQVYLKTAE